MSGGFYEYADYKLRSFIGEFAAEANTPLRKAFLTHLIDVAEAIHDIEWVDSGDYGPGDENESIKKVLGPHWKELTLESVLQEMESTKEQLKELFENE